MIGRAPLAARAVWIAGVGLVVGSIVTVLAGGPGAEGIEVGQLVFALAIWVAQLTFLTMGLLIVGRQTTNRIGLLLLAEGFLLSLGMFATNWSETTLLRDPGVLPAGDAAAWVARLVLPLAFSLFIPIFLLFPDGRPPSRRWRPVLWLWSVAIAITMVSWMTGLAGLPVGTTDDGGAYTTVANPTFVAPWLDRVAVFAGALIAVTTIATAVALVVRFRRAEGDERQQLRWLTTVGVAFVVTFALQFPLAIVLRDPDLEGWIGDAMFMLYASILMIGLPLAMGIAILKYHLYDLDVVIRKAVVVATLAVFITVVYVAAVAGLGSLIDASLALRIGATAVIAVAFQPVRDRANRLANRLVYGKRATPYEVLARFGERVGEAYASDDILSRVARVVADGTASHAEVWLRIGPELRRAAEWPVGQDPAPPPAAVDHVSRIAADHVAPVVQRGETLGAIAVTKGRGEPITPGDAELVDRLADQAGLVVANARLTADLEARLAAIARQAAELRASRLRIVAAQDEERRRLERNIHDGAQQHLVALAVKLRLARSMLERRPVEGAQMLGELRAQVDAAIDTIRSLALGVYPPLLEEHGIAVALASQYGASGLPVRLHGDGLARHPIEIEAAVYFCVLEALQNAAKYAHATEITIDLQDRGAAVAFEVRDDGRGFDPGHGGSGTGVAGMRDRVAVFGGTVDVVSTPGAGTVVTGRIPVPEAVPA